MAQDILSYDAPNSGVPRLRATRSVRGCAAANRRLGGIAGVVVGVAHLLIVAIGPARAAEDLLPDVIALTDVVGAIVIDEAEPTMPGRKLLRFSVATPNIGRGRLEIRASALVSATQQQVVQRVYRDDLTYSERSAGTSTFHPTHHHVHFDDWAAYRLRAVTPSGGVGAIVAQGSKTSFCLSDLVVYDATNPYISFDGNYVVCEFTVQGITPGWMDIYASDLPDQWIDITGVPDGTYWLETEVDPLNKILEQDETNNLSRFKVAIGPAPAVLPDRYEENDSLAEVAAKPAGGTDSANLGTVEGLKVVERLSMDDDGDYFKFHLNQTPEAGGFVRIESPYIGASDLDLFVLNANGDVVNYSDSSGNFEQVPLMGLAPGDYTCFVSDFLGQNPDYRLVIDPSGKLPPSITVTAPAAAGAWVERGGESLPVTWAASDPSGRPTTVSLSVDRDQTLDKATRALLGYQNLDGEIGLANVNTAGLDLGTWYLYATVTNSAGRSGAWAPGSFVVYEKGDLNFDGRVDMTDWRLAHRRRPLREVLPRGWSHILDMDRDGDVDQADFRLLWSEVFSCHVG